MLLSIVISQPEAGQLARSWSDRPRISPQPGTLNGAKTIPSLSEK